MLSEERKKAFKEKLDEVFIVANKIVNNEEVEPTGQLRTWLRNLYFRYKNYKTNTHPEHILPQDHLLVLKTKLKEENLTLDEFENTQGKISILIETIKSKSNTEDSKEELEKLRNNLDTTIASLERKHTKKAKTLYSLSDEDFEKIGKQIEELKEKRKVINKKLEDMKPKEVKDKVETETASKKIEELITQIRKKDAEINELKEEVSKYKEERAYISNKYRNEFEKKIEMKTKQLEEEYDEKMKKELEKKTEVSNKKLSEIKPLQKGTIKKLLFNNESVTLEDIKARLKLSGVSSNKFELALSELRDEIPGIVKGIDGQSYSISANAVNRLEALKQSSVCPKISSVFNGTIEFVVRADLHLPLTYNEEKIKKELNPYFEFCSANRNIPIIDLGDIADTLRNIKYEKWTKMDKEAIKLSYEFYKYYAKVIATAPNIKHYTLLGNHDEHPYLVGVDPIEIMTEYSDNIIPIGIGKGSFLLGNDKVGVFHEIDSVPFTNKDEIYNSITEEMKNIAKDYIYSLIGHYHIGMHNPLQGFSTIANRKAYLFTAEVEDGIVKRMFAQELQNNNQKIMPDQIEIYNSGYQYKK